MRPDRVKHILARNLDNAYVITLCGRVILHRGIFLMNEAVNTITSNGRTT
jgi:hypothetical protein